MNMKKFLFSAMLLTACAAVMALSVKSADMKKRDVLKGLWADYEKAARADRPLEEAGILENIRDRAADLHLPWDFYDAGRKYVNAVQRRDWKMRDQAMRDFASRIEDFGEPVVTLAWMKEMNGSSVEECFALVRDNALRLRGARHEEFYTDLRPQMGGTLAGFIANDYEYALWSLISRSGYDSSSPGSKELYDALSECVGGVYPNGAWLAFCIAGRLSGDDRVAAMDSLVAVYGNTAVGFYPRQELLRHEFSEKLVRSGAGSGEYSAFLARCRDFEKERGKLSGDEASIASGCTGAEQLINTLTAKELMLNAEDGEIKVLFRNLGKASVKVFAADGDEDRPLYEMNAVNPSCSFYVIDTVSLPMPALPDGGYVIKAVSGKQDEAVIDYRQYTISIAGRRDSRGYGIYAADYRSGEPLGAADLKIYSGVTPVFECRDFPLSDTFVRLPDEALTILSDGRMHYIEVSSGSRRSEQMPVYSDEIQDDDRLPRETVHCDIYRDCGAYRPGDTVRFKVVLYRSYADGSVGVCAGESLSAVLYDSENNEISRTDLLTGDFGSAAGEFLIPVGLRNGHFRMAVLRSDGLRICTSYFRVDEFVLPSFDLTFVPDDTAWFRGDDIKVRGRMFSYSGHGVSAASVVYSITRYGTAVASGNIEAAADGSFELSFNADTEGWYDVAVKVTDGTGETHEYRNGVYAGEKVYLSAELKNGSEGVLEFLENGDYDRMRGEILESGTAVFGITVCNSVGKPVPAEIEYRLRGEKGEVVANGICESGKELSVDLSALPSGMYVIEIKTCGEVPEAETEQRFLKISPDDTTVDAPVRHLFMTGKTSLAPGEDIELRMAACDGPVWAVAEVFGASSELLETRALYLGGQRGAKASVADVVFGYRDTYPSAVRLHVFYFKNGRQYGFDREFRREPEDLSLPLEFISFEENAAPSREYTFSFRTVPGAECLVAVFDESMDAVSPNYWNEFRQALPASSRIYYDARCGVSGGSYRFGRRFMTKAASVAGAAMMTDMAANIESEEAVADDAALAAEKIAVRKDFSEVLAFCPFLRSDENGDVSFTFRTSDKLSSYYVAVYAHTADMRNSAFRRIMKVSLPLKLSVAAPRQLYSGDRYEAAVTLSAMPGAEAEGTLFLYAGQDVMKKEMSVADGGAAELFSVNVPDDSDSLVLKAVFVPSAGTAPEYADAVSVTIPVRKPVQTLTEAHSSVLPYGADRDSLVAVLSGRFVNVPGTGAVYTERRLADMIAAALPDKAEPAGNDVLSLSEAYYVRKVAALSGIAETHDGDDEVLLGKIMACRNADGGFAWFEGMKSSPAITAVMLERFGKLASRGLSVPDLTASVRYIDNERFSSAYLLWCGGISLEQYLYVRSMYAEVPFKEKVKDFKKDAAALLIPAAKDGRGLQGRILAKARRVAILRNLSASDAGISLAKSWGFGSAALKKMRKSASADVVSLTEYAVKHRDGGWYYPDAVMPFRGLLESEAYAHSFLCDLMTEIAADNPASAEADRASEIADGIRLWLMLQKETQHWDAEPAFIDAINSVLAGSDELKNTSVLIGSASFAKAFDEIASAGNGFTAERKFFRRDGDSLTEIAPGDSLHTGDRIAVQYRIWNQENRSFVRLTAPREASLSPVDNLSGPYGWAFLPLRLPGFSFMPQGYRNVKADRTEYYFDSFPEENTVITEEFFVTQSGIFSAPSLEIESLYAPHYRANSAWNGRLLSLPALR